MLTKRPLLIALAVLLAIGFAAGLARLFALRYEAGEVYPPYSTFRPDPLGAKGIYAALEDVPGVEVRRNLQPLKKLQPGQPVTLVYLGVSRFSYWTERELQEFDSLVFGGSRAVFAFYPFDRPPGTGEARIESARAREKKKKDAEAEKPAGPDGKKDDVPQPDAKKEKDDDEAPTGLVSFQEMAKRYGFEFAYFPPAKDKAYDRRAALVEARANLEPDLSWHSALFFDRLSSEWRPLYLAETRPVIAERTYGRGSIVLVADSFPFSNEALRDERHSKLLARIFSGPPLVIFDEEHHGVTEQPGIVQLALKYRLHGVIAALLLIGALFVWQNCVRFVPAYAESEAGGDLVSGRDAAQGFDNLLHRAIKPSELLGTCVEEWRRAFPHDPARAKVEEILAAEQSRPPRQRDAVAAFRRIAQALSRK